MAERSAEESLRHAVVASLLPPGAEVQGVAVASLHTNSPAGREKKMTILTATFTDDDFDRWFLEGSERSDPVTADDQAALFENCQYLAYTESRQSTQTDDELREAISRWANTWNVSLECVD